MKPFKRIFLSTLAAGIMGGSVQVSAQPLFTIEEGSVPGAAPNLVTADRLSYEYHSTIVQSIVGGDGLAGSGDTFIENGFLTNTAFGNPLTSLPSQLNAIGANGYGIYATFAITGESDPSGSAGILATFNTMTMTMRIDPNQDTILSVVPGGSVAVGGDASDDMTIATLTLNTGLANFFDASAGDEFNALMNLSLTSAGEAFFISPVPFFNLESVRGNTQSIRLVSAGTDTFTALADGTGQELFLTSEGPASSVPEPGVLALLGIGMLGLIRTTRRQDS